MRVLIAALALLALPGAPAQAGGLICQAEKQCRADAPTLCAPSELRIEVEFRSPVKAWVWFANQGPYPATMSREGEVTVWTLEAFGDGHRLELRADGQFAYLGNLGKRFTGICEAGE